MVRRKGEVTDRHKNLSHPFQVELVIPGAPGFGNAMGIMYRAASRQSHEITSAKEPRRPELQLMRWCFCTREAADAFAADFGGRRVDLPVDPFSLKVDQPDARELARRARAQTFGLYDADC